MLLNIAAILLSLSFLIVIHELGHFLAAKKAGVRILEFGIGYPPKAIKLFSFQGTDFTLNWIPFGGFVRMDGEDALVKEKEKRKKDPQLFFQKNVKQRLYIVLAGPVVNFLFGILAFFILFMVFGIPLSAARVGYIEPNSPAESSKLPLGVNITELVFEDQTVKTNTPEDVIKAVNDHQGKKVTIITTGGCQRLECDQTRHEYDSVIRTKEETPENQGSLGIGFQNSIYYPWYEMPARGLYSAVMQTFSVSKLVLSSLGTMIGDLITKGQIPQDISGPVGIVYFAQKEDIISQGFLFMLHLTGMLSVNLAMINILPIPALDGGRALFISLERFFSKKRLANLESYANYGGYILLLGLIILITLKDVFMIIKG